MTPEDPPFPADDDAVAAAARGALGRLAGTGDAPPRWDEVRARGRRVQVMRYTTVAAACLLLVVAGIGTVAAVTGKSDHVDVAGGGDRNGTTTTVASTTSTTTTTTTTTTTPRTSGPPPVGPPAVATTVPPTPGPSPQTVDFDGSIVAGSETSPVTSVAVGERVEVTTMIRNISSRAIWAASANQPTALATVCHGDAPDTQTLWWMTNLLVEPGASDGRGGTFAPTDAYVGTVTCELVVVTTDLRGTTFDTTAGGDEATALVIAPVTGVASVTFTVVAAPPASTTTTPTTGP